MGERADVFTVVLEAEEVPQELSRNSGKENRGAREIRMTYQDERAVSDTWVRRTEDGGYNISVVEYSEDEENLYFLTQLIRWWRIRRSFRKIRRIHIWWQRRHGRTKCGRLFD